MRKVFLIVCLLLSSAASVFSEEAQKLGRLVVTASRLSTELAESSRSVTVLDKDILESIVYSAIPDAIGNVGGIDVRRRGPEGVQADVSIRGATFEQNTVLVDGVKVNDPQTGHHNMDIALTSMDVERIEVLKGPASSVYGPNSFGGAINIITKTPRDKKILLYSEGGSFDYFKGGLSVSYPFAAIKNRFSFEESRSAGYMPETEFNIISLSNQSFAETFLGDYNFLFGYTKKDFGADSFYSNLYSNEEEHTDTRFFKIDGAAETGDLKIMPKLFLRRHRDKFALDRNRPGWQTNYHTTYNYGGELNFALENSWLDAAYGYELARDTIDSTNVQAHSRTKDGIYLELSPRLAEELYVNVGMREDYFGDFGWQFSPSASASYGVFKGLKLRGALGRSYRIPTFTDLYYNDAANIGNTGLKPESSWTYEAGADYGIDPLALSATYFHRDSYDTIDWTRTSSGNPWRVSNIGSVDTNGVELSLELLPRKIEKSLPVEKIFVNYTTLDSYAKHDYLSKYALDYLKHQICAGAELEAFGFKNSWILNFKKRVGESAYLVVDTKISKDIVHKDKLAFSAYFEASNLFDISYSEQSGVTMPGRWLKYGGRIEF